MVGSLVLVLQFLFWKIANERASEHSERAVCDSSQQVILLGDMIKEKRALWLAERRVWVRVCQNSCDVKMFAFSASITQIRIRKSLLIKNWTTLLYLPIPSSRLMLRKSLQEFCANYFSLKLTFKREKSLFWKPPCCKTRPD